MTELDTTGIVVPYGAGGAGVPEQKYRDVLKLLYAMTDGRAGGSDAGTGETRRWGVPEWFLKIRPSCAGNYPCNIFWLRKIHARDAV